MSRTARRNKEVRFRQQHILESAQQLYAKKGVEEVTMDQIAEAAGYTKRTVYAYFRKKEEIQVALLVKSLVARWEENRQDMASASSPRDKLLAFAESYFRFFERNPSHLQLYAYLDYRGVDQAAARKEIFEQYRTANEEAISHLKTLLEEGIRKGDFRRDINVDMTISHLVYTLRTVLNRAFSRTYSFARFDAEQYYREYLALFMRGISRTGNTRATRPEKT